MPLRAARAQPRVLQRRLRGPGRTPPAPAVANAAHCLPHSTLIVWDSVGLRYSRIKVREPPPWLRSSTATETGLPVLAETSCSRTSFTSPNVIHATATVGHYRMNHEMDVRTGQHLRQRPHSRPAGKSGQWPFRYAPRCALIGYGITDGGSADQRTMLDDEGHGAHPAHGATGCRPTATLGVATSQELWTPSQRPRFERLLLTRPPVLVLSQVVDSPAGWECCRRPIGAATPS